MDFFSLTGPSSINSALVCDETIREHYNTLRKKNVQTKKLDFSFFNQEHEKIEHWLGKLEPYLNECKIIKIKLPFRLSDKSLTNASHILYKFYRLEYLKINAMGSRQVSDKGLNALSKTLSKLHSLKRLKLDFSRCSGVSDKGLAQLGQNICRLQNVTSLHVNFASCEKLTNAGVIAFAQKVSKLTKLTKLAIILSNCFEITDEGISGLSKSLAANITLKNLSIKLYRCSLTDGSLLSLSENLIYLKDLETLSLTLSSGTKTQFNGITEQGVEKLSASLTTLGKLKSADIKFGWSDTLNDKALYLMNQNLVKLRDLNHLQLGFYYCKEITDSGVKSLIKNLRGLKGIESFKMSLWTCENTTEDSLINIGQEISKLPALKFTQLASEVYGWRSFETKNCLFKFITGIRLRKIEKKITENSTLIFWLIVIFAVLSSLFTLNVFLM